MLKHENHQDFMVLSVPSRRPALVHGSHCYAERDSLRRDSSRDLAVGTLAVSACLCSVEPSSSKKRLHSSRAYRAEEFLVLKNKNTAKQKTKPKKRGTLPQRDGALRGGGAISRVMSCAQFPPDNKLCFMAASALSIPSEGTSAMNRALPHNHTPPPSSPGGSRVTFSLFLSLRPRT